MQIEERVDGQVNGYIHKFILYNLDNHEIIHKHLKNSENNIVTATEPIL